ncbi:unnamed protein product [Adineta steineri]|uniref:Uncharacterized protein n=1 Tax=Adineta steineri TaxID=433720 RepID=A0A819PBZ2_9BILA|nr:unnamed protein product [Adineta steineri]CAF4010358.1 unnamed protein product [Adineta steineri]
MFELTLQCNQQQSVPLQDSQQRPVPHEAQRQQRPVPHQAQRQQRPVPRHVQRQQRPVPRQAQRQHQQMECQRCTLLASCVRYLLLAFSCFFSECSANIQNILLVHL